MQRVRRILKRIRERPFRVVEALAVIAGAVGVMLAPDTVEAVGTLVAIVVGGGEFAQAKTTPLSNPRLRGPADHHDAKDAG